MTDYGTLALAFATAVAGGAGKRLIDWLKRHFDSNAAEAADTLVADRYAGAYGEHRGW